MADPDFNNINVSPEVQSRMEAAYNEIMSTVGNAASKGWQVGTIIQKLTQRDYLSQLQQTDPDTYANVNTMISILKKYGLIQMVKDSRTGQRFRNKLDITSKFAQFLNAKNAGRRMDLDKTAPEEKYKTERNLNNIEGQKVLNELIQSLPADEAEAIRRFTELNPSEFIALQAISKRRDAKQSYIGKLRNDETVEILTHLRFLNNDGTANWGSIDSLLSAVNKLIDTESNAALAAANPTLFAKMKKFAADSARGVSGTAGKFADSQKDMLRKMFPEVARLVASDPIAYKFMIGQIKKSAAGDIKHLVDSGIIARTAGGFNTTALGKAIQLYHTEKAHIIGKVKDDFMNPAASRADGDKDERRAYIDRGIRDQFRNNT